MEAICVWHRGLYFPSGELDARAETNLVVLHHTGGAPGEDPDAEEIDAIHRRLGWTGVGYHFLIRRDGSIEEGRPAFAVGAHAEGANRKSVGVALGGNFCEDDPTAAQLESCAMLLAVLSVAFGFEADAEHIIGHRDLAPTACPGEQLYAKIPELIGKANWYLEQ